MRLPRLPLLILGIAVILGLMVWLVSSLLWLYRSVFYTSPFLANLLLLLLIGLFLALLGALAYYVWVFSRKKEPRQQRQPPQVPAQKSAAAVENLRAIRQQIQQIEDQVAREVLLSQTRNIAQDLSRRQLKLVVFGVGSAGKTSLVNALMGRIAGQVGPTIGTTEVGETYSCYLPRLNRELLITDTPGLLEPGIMGTAREQAARKLATEADLLLFVVDGDLTQSEYQPLRSLEDMGKRLLLVFNKIDRYSAADQEAVLKVLCDRTRLSPEDIVAISAAPQPLQLANGQGLEPEPDLRSLLQRLGTILHEEGDDLLADNILLQSQRLSTEARDLIAQERQGRAEKVVERFQWIGAGVIWATPIVIDLLAAAAVNAQMVIEIAKVYGCELSKEEGKELARSLAKTLGGLGIVKGVLSVVTRALEFSVAGYVLGKTVQSISTAYLTRIAGNSFIEYFRNDQDWGDGGMAEVVQQQFQLNRRDQFVKKFIQDAIIQLPKSFGRALQPWSEQPLEMETAELISEEEYEK
ncbi:MAG: GTP-binding protein [Cyanobacteria bacterium P01_A01_bin.17]